MKKLNVILIVFLTFFACGCATNHYTGPMIGKEYDEYVKKERNKTRWRAIFQGIGQGMSGVNAAGQQWNNSQYYHGH